MASDSAFSPTLDVAVVPKTGAACNNASSCVSKSANSVAFAPSLFLLSLIACSALMLTPHPLAIGLFIIQCLYRASESPALEENQTDFSAERRERSVKSPSQEYTRMRSSHSATPDRSRSPQLTGKPQAPECTLRAPSKFVLFFAPLHSELLIGI